MVLKYDDFRPEDWQERHSPTQEAVLRDAENKIIGVCRRRIADARVWDKIAYWNLEREAVRICRAYHFISFGRECRTSRLVQSFERGGLESFMNDIDFLHYLMRCKDDYVQWAMECKKHKVSKDAVIDLLYFNMNVKDIEAKYHKRHGWAVHNLIKGLKLYE